MRGFRIRSGAEAMLIFGKDKPGVFIEAPRALLIGGGQLGFHTLAGGFRPPKGHIRSLKLADGARGCVFCGQAFYPFYISQKDNRHEKDYTIALLAGTAGGSMQEGEPYGDGGRIYGFPGHGRKPGFSFSGL